METINILHTNDLHSHFEEWPKLSRYIAEARAKNPDLLLFDIGDFMDRWHPLTEATDGQINIDLMNQAGYDAVTIGNNEGIGNSHEQLQHLFDHAQFDVILDNLYQKDRQRPKFAQPYKIIETKQQHKIGVIGMTACYPLTYNPNGWEIKEVDEVLAGVIAELKTQDVSAIILLSHLGLPTDRRLAQDYPDLDLILGSHTHHLLPEGEQVNQTMLAAAGKYGQNIGNVTLTFNDDGKLDKVTAYTTPTSSLPEESGDEAQIDSWLTQGHTKLQEELVADLPDTFEDVEVTNEVLLKSVAKQAKTDLAILNSGLAVTPLEPGRLTYDELHQSMPHPMHLIRVTLSGYNLWRLIREMEKIRLFLSRYPMNGMGFRGKIFGNIRYLGIDYQPETKQVYVKGQPLDLGKHYTLTTVDHYLFIPFFPTIEIAGEIEFLFPDFLRNSVAHYLKQNYPIKE
ncbi:metallophosphoesterase [Holzapfeliella sp. He02]|uniref:Metallophosphoesterase n=1 Tax=Holzapfeliella saturejae TaxID=3082953 RepID=A0ABU8SHG5_9LACO